MELYLLLCTFFKRFCQDVINFIPFLAVIIKNAHIPFSSWFPAVMASHTPACALFQSFTLVTVSVYLLIRFNVAFSDS